MLLTSSNQIELTELFFLVHIQVLNFTLLIAFTQFAESLISPLLPIRTPSENVFQHSGYHILFYSMKLLYYSEMLSCIQLASNLGNVFI